ncbi:MAG: M20/M25/M40 family metallo-hydrolase [Flavobacteriaceae bacterium]
MKFRILFAFILVASLTSCQTEKEVTINKEALLANLKELSSDAYEGRGFSRPGNYRAQKLIASKFKELGLDTYLESGYIQQFDQTLKGRTRQYLFPIADAKKDFSNVPDTTVVGGNVVGVIKGKSDKAIVITGHLDHLGIRNGKIYNGADDDASGTVALFAMAEYFKNKSPNHTLIFAAVDAEEIGSHGAEYFAANFKDAKEKIALNVNMDMIAHNDSLRMYASGLYHYPQLKPQLENIESPITLLFGHDDPKDKKLQDWTFSSDHRIFHKRGIPFIYFGVEDHKDYHQDTDTFENINQDFYYEAVKLIIQVIENYDQTL